ncbi:hypothetical protein XmelCFBP4644_00380 [Xanthomonas melonis]|uniref:Uncharacterized protein n=1 Tax=Xanthomonas melonis TaxID=56456 RepID=A0A2S7DKV5_9XANT|nr:hypothetical protein XmelCFBP4644_00380 [Xanthomonas melonis]
MPQARLAYARLHAVTAGTVCRGMHRCSGRTPRRRRSKWFAQRSAVAVADTGLRGPTRRLPVAIAAGEVAVPMCAGEARRTVGADTAMSHCSAGLT